VIFTSDHGANGNGGSNGPFRGSKGSLWEGGVRIPCLLHWPGTIPEASVSSALTVNIDLLPTIAAVADIDPPTDRTIDGVDCSEMLFETENAASPHEYVYHYDRTGSNDERAELAAIRDADGWKLHRDTGELYHLPTDVGECEDVAEANPTVVERLESCGRMFDREIGDQRE